MTQTLRRTRILSTLGPATSSKEMIEKLVEAGVNVFRLNFSHGQREVHERNVSIIREVSEKTGVPIGILQDLQGPKIRCATFAEGKVQLENGQGFRLTCDDDTPGDNERVGVTYKNLCEDVSKNDLLLLDDGRLTLRVTAVQGRTIDTEVVRGGPLSNNKGINIPGANLSVPALTDKDTEDLAFGATLNVDWLAMSFVRTRDDLLLARHYMRQAGSTAKLMAKIEKPAAVENFDDILREVDGIMVARGDLGVEVSAERVPNIQKRLIRACRDAGKPVVTATQMLETMIQNPFPTRAEASDVANAIYDGTDAVMLSGETAVGAYPVEAVAMMDRIARTVEADPAYQKSLLEQHPAPQVTVADSVALAACEMAHNLSAKVIVTFTQTGSTAQRVARNRYPTTILAITTSEVSYNQLAVCWGVVPVLRRDVEDTEDMIEVAKEVIRKRGIADEGDFYVITAGVPFGIRGTTNMIHVKQM